MESNSPDKACCFKTPAFEKGAGLATEKDSTRKKKKFSFKRGRQLLKPILTDDGAESNDGSKKKRKFHEMDAKRPPPAAKKPPRVFPTGPNEMTDKEVHRKTAFPNKPDLLKYIIMMHNGNAESMGKTVSSLSWFEEHVLYFEWSYHQTERQHEDMVAYSGIDLHAINKIKDRLLAVERAALDSWSKYVSHAEDLALRNQIKWSRYSNVRAIFHDSTNVPAVQYSDAAAQRMTYSEYYGMCCMKGGVSIMLCGWLLVGLLWGGGVSDSQYNKKEGYLEAQAKFVETDLVDGKKLTFVNILDRGYRAKRDAWEAGMQLAVQPPSARSDRRFRGTTTIFAGTVAHDRSGNERGVRVVKRSGLFHRGFKPGMDAERFQNAWRVSAYRANFIYKSVL